MGHRKLRGEAMAESCLSDFALPGSLGAGGWDMGPREWVQGLGDSDFKGKSRWVDMETNIFFWHSLILSCLFEYNMVRFNHYIVNIIYNIIKIN